LGPASTHFKVERSASYRRGVEQRTAKCRNQIGRGRLALRETRQAVDFAADRLSHKHLVGLVATRIFR
jgi:hypothetical protein